jgi:hypothetical protein
VFAGSLSHYGAESCATPNSQKALRQWLRSIRIRPLHKRSFMFASKHPGNFNSLETDSTMGVAAVGGSPAPHKGHALLAGGD